MSKRNATSVLLVDDHELIRAGLRRIILDEMGIELIEEAYDCASAVAAVRNRAFDVVLLDLVMPGRGGLEALEELKRLRPEMPVLILSSLPEEQYAIRCLKSGAAGFLSKNSAPAVLVEAIRRVLNGRRYISAVVVDRLAEDLEHGHVESHDALSPREFQILCKLGEGMTVTEIAEEFALSPKTVSTHRTRILQKLGLRRTADLIRYAIEHRLVLGSSQDSGQ